MDELEDALARQEMMSHREILERFKKLFGRDMTPMERQTFFLPDQGPPKHARYNG